MPQHHRALVQRPRKLPIEVQRRCEARHSLFKLRQVRQFFACQALQYAQAGAFIGLCKHHVKAHRPSVLPLEQLVGQSGHLVARPRPTAHFGQAFFIDVDNDNPVVQRLRHGDPQPGVVNEVVDPVEQIQPHSPHHVEDDHHDGDDGERKPEREPMN